MLETKDCQIEIGDGGFVDWISQILGNKKERCLISGIGLDRLLLFHEWNKNKKYLYKYAVDLTKWYTCHLVKFINKVNVY